MNNYNRKELITQESNTPYRKTSWINIQVNNNDYTAFIDNDLPIPTILQHRNTGYSLHWEIDGFFATQKNRDYFLDVSQKIAVLFNDSALFEYRAKVNAWSKFCEMVYYLKDFSHIQDKRKKSRRTFNKANHGLLYQDKLFELARFKCYDLKLENRLTYEAVYDVFYTMNNTYDLQKSPSDIKAKAKNVYNWVDKNYDPIFFTEEEKIEARRITKRKYNNKINKTILTGEDELMTRSENMIKQNKILGDKYKEKVLNITTGMFKDEYKKSNGKWNISKIAKEIDVSRNTVMKYI